ncbi:MAG: hypothetical protein HYX24_02610 [Candidatus Aenigmarchaeota archaeon]|nr:hypothetical protein [Candidatus Aenigmarchaeota archaeon]
MPVSAASISAATSKIVYAVGETLTVTGTSGSASSVTLTATIYNSSSSIMAVSSAASSGLSPNSFSLSVPVNSSYSKGSYFLILSDGTDSVNLSFRVISQAMELEAHFMSKPGEVVAVRMDTVLQDANESFLNGSFGELLNMSRSASKTVHYGNASISGKTYHFALVDPTNSTIFDRLYIDDDTAFRLVNDSEDASDVEYQNFREGSSFSNGTFTYVVGEVEENTGNRLILWKPPTKPVYNTTDLVNITVVAKNSTHLLAGQPVEIEILNSSGQNVTPSAVYVTDSNGWINLTVNLSQVRAGLYTISMNDSLGMEMLPVEAFQMFVEVADLSGNPTAVFGPNSKARVIVTSKTSAGPFNLTSLAATIYYPNGTSVSKARADFTQTSDGVYRYDIDLGGAPTGGYGLSIAGSDGTNNQTFSTGFEVQAADFEAMAINVRYVEDAEGTGAMVNAFAPNKNVTIMTFLTNISAGGLEAKGVEGFEGLLAPGNCSASVTVMDVRDENDISYTADYRAMNLSAAMGYLSDVPAGTTPPQGLESQCMVIFPNTNLKNGIYRIQLRMYYQGQYLFSGATFGVQRVLARGSTVDFRGDDFGFFAPNSTVRIKLSVRDLVTDQDLPASNITSGKIIEMRREFPEFKDIMGNSTLRNNMNESVVNGTISFLAPNDEGFFAMKFRFTANVGNTTETGLGDAFFMLKKYMIWGQLPSVDQGQWFVRVGQNITLQVTVMDIGDAQSVFGGYKSQKSCTGCTGLVINASAVFNDQQFRRVSGYTMQTGTITNSTNPVANVTIVPAAGGDMQGGWYHVDLIATDPATNATYFGWAWFDVRNFWVEAQAATPVNATHYQEQSSMGGPGSGATFASGQPVYFTIVPREPGTWNILSVDSAPTVLNVQQAPAGKGGGPIAPISGFSASASQKNVSVCPSWMGGQCYLETKWVINLTGLPSDKQGNFQANVRVTNSNTSDTGSFWFSVSSYRVRESYRQNSMPPMFAATENLTVNFTATNFDSSPHNITNVTIEDMFSSRQGRPVSMRYGRNYTTSCSGNRCTTNVFLANLGSGDYNARFTITDVQNVQKSSEVFFRIQGTVVNIPSMSESWVWQSDDASEKIERDVMRGEWSSCSGQRNSVPNASRFCGQYWAGSGQVNFNLTAPNVSYTKEFFGYIPLMEDWWAGQFGSVANKSRMYMYSNGSMLWVSSSSNLTKTDASLYKNLTAGGTFADSKGGIWRLDALGDQNLVVFGINTLYSTGILINTSYSRSGFFKLGQIREADLGAYTPQGRTGLDLDGDGYANRTAYFVISDNAASGVYDTFFFSTDGNFTGNASPVKLNPLSVNDANRTNREFGLSSDAKQRLTLLSIDPRAQNVRFYSKQVGDWAYLGEIKYLTNITIPVLVIDPSGAAQTSTVTVSGYKNSLTWRLTQTDLASAAITGIGELRFNTSLMGMSGRYRFAIKTDDTIEEWKWPEANVRGFLVDGTLGEAAYIGGYKPLPIYRWDRDTYGEVPRLQQDNRNSSSIVNGVLLHADPFDYSSCQLYNSTGQIPLGQINPNITAFLRMDWNVPSSVYFFYNSTESNLYMNNSGCVFNTSAAQTAYQQGSYLTFNTRGKNYNTTVLRINVYQYAGCGGNDCWRADFGIAGISNLTMLPVQNTGNPQWPYGWGYMQNVSIGGTGYDVLFANDSYSYQRCIYENINECAKKAFLVQTSNGNFSGSIGVNIGQNFTSDLYLAKIGPWDNDGILAGNFSQLPGGAKPAIADISFADGTTSYFNALNETVLGIDLDKDGYRNKTFYMLAFDNNFDGVQQLTSNIVDDDLQLVGWTSTVNGSSIDIDFSGTEIFLGSNASWTKEKWEGLPTGVWQGSARFGDDYAGVSWEQQPWWQMPFYNSTTAILSKDKWRASSTDNMSVVVKVYNFDQSAIANANVSVTQVARATFSGFQIIPPSGYSVDNTYNRTDSYGYSLVRVSPVQIASAPAGTWPDGNYQIMLNIQASAGNETYERWFCVGVCGW